MSQTKYQPFINYLKECGEDSIKLTFREIEDILGFTLTQKQKSNRSNWSNSDSIALARSWLDAGFKVCSVDMKNETICFKKSNNITVREYAFPMIPKPSKEVVEEWLHKWDELEGYADQEKAINIVFLEHFPKNDNLQEVLIKCSILNDFYSTNIFNVYQVAKHIHSLNIDERLKKGDASLVNDIASINLDGKKKNFYSFASKYCSHHNQLDFPIYDSYVRKVLQYFKKEDHFAEFKDADLKIYKYFKEIVFKFQKFYRLEMHTFKELDIYLWQFGKLNFPNLY